MIFCVFFRKKGINYSLILIFEGFIETDIANAVVSAKENIYNPNFEVTDCVNSEKENVAGIHSHTD